MSEAQVLGRRILLRGCLGEKRLQFGPADRQQGAQGLEAIRFETAEGGEGPEQLPGPGSPPGPRLRLRWRGLAGAGVGLAHGLAASPGVLYTDYPQVPGSSGPSGLQVGGDREVVVETVVPALTCLMVGLDDTDSPTGGATWPLGLELAKLVPERLPGSRVLDQRLVQLWPGVAEKTSNCVALGLRLALAPGQAVKARDIICDHIARVSHSPETGLAFYEGVRVPTTATELCHAARRERVALEQVWKVAAGARVVLEPVVGQRGLIGALAALGGLDLGPEVAGTAPSGRRDNSTGNP